MNTPENNETMCTALGCCTSVTDTLIVEAFFASPTESAAAAVAALLNERGYQVSVEELMGEA